MAEPLLFCHPDRDPLALKVLVTLEVKEFLRNDKIKGKGIKLGGKLFRDK